MGRTQPPLAGWRCWKGPQVREFSWPLETENDPGLAASKESGTSGLRRVTEFSNHLNEAGTGFSPRETGEKKRD